MSGRYRLSFQFNWKITAFTLLMLPILIGLGVWQLQRAQQKQTIQEHWLQQQALPPVAMSQLDQRSSMQFRRVIAEGDFIDDRYWLLENKFYNQQWGYQVVMAFRTRDDRYIVVNRGWVAGSAYRDQLPEFSIPPHSTRIVGTVANPSKMVLVDESQSALVSWPHLLLEIDIDVMARQLGQPLQPFVLRLDADSPGALAVAWQPINMTPARHRGYAIQWFALAVALLVLFVFGNSNIKSFFNRNRNDVDH